MVAVVEFANLDRDEDDIVFFSFSSSLDGTD